MGLVLLALSGGEWRHLSSFLRLPVCTGHVEFFLQEFGVSYAGLWSIHVMIEEFLLHPPFRERGSFLWLVAVHVLWDMGGRGGGAGRNNRCFMVEKEVIDS